MLILASISAHAMYVVFVPANGFKRRCLFRFYKYRSTIFYHTPEKREIAKGFLKELVGLNMYDYKVKTTVVNAGEFYRAEEYHQHYYAKMK